MKGLKEIEQDIFKIAGYGVLKSVKENTENQNKWISQHHLLSLVA